MTKLARLFIWGVFAIGTAVSSSVPALAHKPYFTQVEKIALPGGETGEIRLLYGDGILSLDPVWAIIANSGGRAIARTDKALLMTIVCTDDHRCHAIDLERNIVFEPDPATFRYELWGLGSDTWTIIDRKESWGFVTRPATSSEIANANFAFANNHKFALFVPFALAVLGAGILLTRLRLKSPSPTLKWLILIAVGAVRLAAVAILLCLSLFWVWLAGMTDEQWIVVSAAGGAFGFALMHLARRLRARPTPA